MNIFRKKYFIYPEIQKPILIQIVLGFVALCVIQALCIYFSFQWLEQTTRVNLNILVDYRILGPWKNLLILAICVPLIMNLFFSILASLYVSNKFAGPIYRIEKEIDQSLHSKSKLAIKLRKDDYLKSLADKINKLSES